jgi:ATP-dependent DNA ligase
VFAERLKSEGKEGVVLKDVTKGYYEDVWVKDKKVETGDFKIVDFQEGTGKYKGKLGALVVEHPKTHVTSRVGSGFSDFEREWFWKNREEVQGSFTMVDAHETTRHGVLRGPRFVGLHPESGIVIQDEQGLRDYAKGAGISPYQVKSAAGWRGKR